MTSMGDLISRATSQSEYSELLANDQFGIYPAKAYLELDGVTDDYSALYALINTTIDGENAEIHFKNGTCLIGSDITIPSNVKLVFLNGGMLKPSSGVTVTGSDAKIEAGLTQIFDISDGGSVSGTWDFDILYPEWFGAVGSGTADDTAELQAALTLSQYKIIRLMRNKNYAVTDELIMQDDCVFEFNGAKITMTLTGTDRGLVVGNRNKLYNVNIDMVDNSGTAGGQYQCPITIGEISTDSTLEDVCIDGLRLSNTKSNSVCVGIWGGCKNIHIKNVNIADSATIGRVFAIHWGGTADPTAGTTHPSNIKIENVNIGQLTNASTDAAIAYIATGYNIEINNVYAELVGYYAFYVYAGDYGFQYASTRDQQNAMRNIKISNVNVKSEKYFALVDGEVPLGTTTTYEMDVVFDNIKSIGKGTSAAGSGFVLDHCDGVSISNFDITGHYHGIGFSTYVKRLKVTNGRIHSNYSAGIYMTNTPTDCIIDGVEFYLNCTGDSGNYRSGIYINTGERTKIKNCIFGDATAETKQNYGVYLSNNVVDTEFLNNYVRKVISGGAAYVLGSSGVNGTTRLFQNNFADYSILNKKAGQLPCVTQYTIGQNDREIREFTSDTTPSGSGTYNHGDRVYYEEPASGGAIGDVCTVSGTFGTLNSGATTGAIDTTTTTLTVNSASGLTAGVYITIAGVSGVKRVTAVSGTTITIDSASDATVTGAAVAYSAPTFKTFGAIA